MPEETNDGETKANLGELMKNMKQKQAEVAALSLTDHEILEAMAIIFDELLELKGITEKSDLEKESDTTRKMIFIRNVIIQRHNALVDHMQSLKPQGGKLSDKISEAVDSELGKAKRHKINCKLCGTLYVPRDEGAQAIGYCCDTCAERDS